MTATDPQKTLQALLDGEHAATRDRVREWLSIPGNGAVADDLPTEDHRARVLAWATELATEGDTAMGYPVEYAARTPSPARSPASRRSRTATCRCSSSAASSSACSAALCCTWAPRSITSATSGRSPSSSCPAASR